MKNKLSLVVLTSMNVIFYFVMLITNTLAVLLPINNKTTVELSDKYANLFVPSGATFSIWGLIYTLMLFLVFYQLFLALKGKMEFLLSCKAQYLIGLSCIFNASWIMAWHYEFLLISVFIMMGLLLTLIFLFLEISQLNKKSLATTFFIKTPIDVYLVWISVATIANITAWFVSKDWNGMGISQSTWTIVILGVGTILGILMLKMQQNITYVFVLIWAYIGILSKRQESEVQYPMIINTLYITLGILFLGVVYTMISKQLKRK